MISWVVYTSTLLNASRFHCGDVNWSDCSPLSLPHLVGQLCYSFRIQNAEFVLAVSTLRPCPHPPCYLSAPCSQPRYPALSGRGALHARAIRHATQLIAIMHRLIEKYITYIKYIKYIRESHQLYRSECAYARLNVNECEFEFKRGIECELGWAAMEYDGNYK